MAEKEDPVIPDVPMTNALLDIVHKTRELPNLLAINGAAMSQLVQINTGLVEAQQKAAEDLAKKEAEEASKAQKEKQYA